MAVEGVVDCAGCRTALGFDFTMAFQPIVDLGRDEVWAHEALVRAPGGGGGALEVLSRVTPETRFAFDQAARVRAVELAAALRLPGRISINFLPSAVYEPAHCLRTTLAAARRAGMPLDRIVLEITEGEKVVDPAHLRRIVDTYKRSGLLTAFDDFGAGWSGLGLLAEYQPDLIKLDMALVRGIDADATRRAIVAGVLGVCRSLAIAVVAEGVETEAEMRALRALGVELQQGYLFARPQAGVVPAIAWPASPPVPAPPLAGAVGLAAH